MTSHPASLDRMLAAWNEADPGKVRTHLEAALSTSVEFIDPSVVTRGIDEFEANVHEVHGQIPGASYHRTSAVDSHHGLHRYSWEIRQNGDRLIEGFDVTEVDDDGRVVRVLGFFGPLPEMES